MHASQFAATFSRCMAEIRMAMGRVRLLGVALSACN